MKKLLALFCGLIFFAACSREEQKEGVIAADKMSNLLIDMHLADASLSKAPNADTMLMKAKIKYNYIFDRYQTDSVAFTRSLQYYSTKKPQEFISIYNKVIDSLEYLSANVSRKAEPFRLPFSADTLLPKVRVPYKTDGLRLQPLRKEIKEDTIPQVVN